MRDHFGQISGEIEVCKGMCEADSDCTYASLNLRRQFFSIEFTIKSARKLVFELRLTVDLSFCSAAFF